MDNNYVSFHAPDLIYDLFDFYKVDFRLITPMLGPCPSASIWNQHVQSKAKKEIEKAKRHSAKIDKIRERESRDGGLSLQREISELKGILRGYMSLTGELHALPENPTVEELLEIARVIEKEFEEKVKGGEVSKATIFMKDEDGNVLLGPHIVLGLIKAVQTILVATSSDEDKKSAKKDGDISSKKGVSETLSMDIKWVDDFMRPNKNVLMLPEGRHIIKLNEISPKNIESIIAEINEFAEKHPDEKIPGMVPAVLERPLLSEKQGVKVSSISMSQILPAGAEFSVHLRIRKDSPYNSLEKLAKLFTHGKNLGFGQWRGSGGFGLFDFRLFSVKDPRKLQVVQLADEGWM